MIQTIEMKQHLNAKRVMHMAAAILAGVALLGLLGLSAVYLFPYPTAQWLDERMNTLSGGKAYNRRVSTLHGVWEPVTEEIQQPIDLTIISGAIPERIDGVYLRTGPNELSGPHRHGMTYHLFDGHGFLHVIALNGAQQTATYTRSWFHTPRYEIEQQKEQDVFPRLGTLVMPYLLVRLATAAQKRKALGLKALQIGPANTHIHLIGNRLFALNEASLPFEFALKPHASNTSKNGYVVESLGYEDWGGKLNNAFTAHPRHDRQTGATVFASYDASASNFPVGEVSPTGELVSVRHIPGRHPGSIGWAHDCALTRHHLIIPDGGMLFHMASMARGIFFDRISTLGFTVVPRNDTQPPFVVTSPLNESLVHIATAWETEDAIVVVAPISPTLKGLPVNRDNTGFEQFDMAKLTLPKRNGTLVKETIHSPLCSPEFPRVHPQLDGGERVRFAFASCLVAAGDKREMIASFSGWAKYDLVTMELVAYVPLAPDWVMGEMVPIAKHADDPRQKGGSVDGDGSDDVWLVGITVHVETREARIVVYDGESGAAEPVVVLGVPGQHRIPLGFHGQFYARSDLEKQVSRSRGGGGGGHVPPEQAGVNTVQEEL